MVTTKFAKSEKADLKSNVLALSVTIQPQNEPLMLSRLLNQVLLQLILVLLENLLFDMVERCQSCLSCQMVYNAS